MDSFGDPTTNEEGTDESVWEDGYLFLRKGYLQVGMQYTQEISNKNVIFCL